MHEIFIPQRAPLSQVPPAGFAAEHRGRAVRARHGLAERFAEPQPQPGAHPGGRPGPRGRTHDCGVNGRPKKRRFSQLVFFRVLFREVFLIFSLSVIRVTQGRRRRGMAPRACSHRGPEEACKPPRRADVARRLGLQCASDDGQSPRVILQHGSLRSSGFLARLAHKSLFCRK